MLLSKYDDLFLQFLDVGHMFRVQDIPGASFSFSCTSNIASFWGVGGVGGGLFVIHRKIVEDPLAFASSISFYR